MKSNPMYARCLRFNVICLLAALLVGCSGDDLLDIVQAEPSGQAAPFQWTRAEDVENRSKFLRNFGVGYSYDAIRGSYCNWEDIRCQVLNRDELEFRQKYRNTQMIVSQRFESYSSDQTVNYSHRDYVQTLDLMTKKAVNFGLYGSEERKRQYVLEDGVKDCFYFTTQDNLTKGEQYIMPAQVMAAVDEEWRGTDHTTLLTKSFQDAIDHLAWNYDPSNYAIVDSFINVWGTHVVTHALLGGTMQLTLKNDMWRYKDIVKEEKFTSVELLGAYEERKKNRHDDNYTWTEQSSLYIDARGGDQSYMGNLLGETNYEGTRDINLEDVTKWRMSIVYDPDDEKASNCEMVSMEVEPIWNFVCESYAHVKEWLRAAIEQDAAIYQQMLGDRNFFSVKFPIRYDKASCQWRKDTGTWQQLTRTDSEDEPLVVNIMSGGRYVATVCHEIIDNEVVHNVPMWVCYPIYEGKVKQACGVGVADDNSVYDVMWINGRLTATLREEKADGMFYINYGGLELEPRDNIDYPDYQVLPYIELSGGVKPDGTYAAEVYQVMKVNDEFQFMAPAGKTDIVGFTDTEKPWGDTHLYKRNSDYIYIYNQNEIKELK